MKPSRHRPPVCCKCAVFRYRIRSCGKRHERPVPTSKAAFKRTSQPGGKVGSHEANHTDHPAWKPYQTTWAMNMWKIALGFPGVVLGVVIGILVTDALFGRGQEFGPMHRLLGLLVGAPVGGISGVLLGARIDRPGK